MSPNECQASVNGFNPNSAVCGRTQGNSCDADVGSALACTKGNGKYLLKGIYSAETACGSNQVVTFTKMDVQFIKGNKAGAPQGPARYQPQQPQQPINYQPQQPQQQNRYQPQQPGRVFNQQANTPQAYSVPSTRAPSYLPPSK